MGVYYLFVFCSAGNWTQGLVLAFTTEKYALPPQCISWLSTLFYWFIFSATALHSFDFNIFHITLNIFLLSCDSYSIWIQRLLNSSIFKITIGNVILINLYNFHIAVILYTFFFFFWFYLVCTQRLVFARQGLYHLNHTPSPFMLQFIFM
jgi:hypothetical protein